ncbi:HPr family phosphocarrier protein [Pontiella sp.]|uniref:HPr family phosphocarrier protein n=1 Tax=Pontiella sp. TaxID=2837462 RepID=UPI00356A0A07
MKQVDREITLRIPAGLHMRPAAEIARIAHAFDAKITFHAQDQSADARSMLHLVILCAAQGDRLKLSATGNDAHAAIEAISTFLGGYTEDEMPPETPA